MYFGKIKKLYFIFRLNDLINTIFKNNKKYGNEMLKFSFTELVRSVERVRFFGHEDMLINFVNCKYL